MKRLALILLLIAQLSIVNCQLSIAQIGTWKAYMSYYEPQQIVKAGANTLFVRASNSLYSYNLNDHSITTYDKVNTLNDTYINFIAWNQQVKQLMVVYQNGNIDLLDLNDNVTNISSYYSKTMTKDKTINKIYVYQQYAYLCTGFGIVKINMQRAEISESYILDQNIVAVNISGNQIYAKAKDGKVFVATMTANLIDKSNWQQTDTYPSFTDDTADWDNYIATVKTLQPGGPKNNTHGYMRFENQKLYTCEGSLMDGSNTTHIQTLSDGEWVFMDDENVKPEKGINYYNAMCLDTDPNDDTHMFVGTRTGLFEFRNGKIANAYNSTNSPIEAFDGKSVDYELITGVKCLSDGRVLFMNSQAPTQSLIELSQDGKFTSHSIPVLMKLNQNGYTNKSLGDLSDLRLDNNGHLWFVNNNWYIPSLYRYDIDTKKILSFTSFKNQDGLSIENINYVSCTMEDKDGNVWVGTQQGPLLLEKDQIEASSPVFTQVKVPRNDGTNYADYLLTGIGITSICIDGGGRKWFGTENNGVYLISEDNLTQIHHFTTDNSKLLSDHITSISVNNKTGEVFFGTERGLCSYISDATSPASEMNEDDVYAYPNPVEPGYTGLITVVGLSYDADVKILTSSGRLVAQGRSNGGTFTWNGCDQQGRRVASGVYMVATATSNGDKGIVCKIAVIN